MKYIIYNLLVVSIFAALSVFFDKWFIVLFALLFILVPSVGVKHRRKCDDCGKQSEPADSTEEAIKKAKEAGWVHLDISDKDYCPDCFRKLSGGGRDD